MAESASTNVFRAVIAAVDKVSGPIGEIMGKVKALVGEEKTAAHEEAVLHKKGEREAHTHARAFHALSAHVRILRGHFGNLTASLGQFGQSFSQLIPALAGLGAAGSLVGLFEMTNHAAEAFSQLSSTARMAGVSVQTFSALSLAAKENDVPVQQLRTSLFNLSKIMGGALAGSNKKALVLFQHLGIALKDSHGQALAASQVLPQLADAFEHTKSATMRALMAQTLFGGRAGAMLLPILMKGRAGLEAYSAAYAKIGYVPTGPAAEQLEAFHASWVQLTTAVEGFTMEVGAKLAPVLKPVIDLASKWVAANREWIATGIASAVGRLATWLGKLNIHQIIADTQGWIASIRSTVAALGGMKAIIGAVTLVVGSPLITAIGAGIAIFSTLRSIIVAVGVAAMENPIILAAVLIGAAAYEIYKHWKPIKAFFAWVWGGIKTAIAAAWTYVGPILGGPLLFAAKEIYEHWSVIKTFFADLWGGIVLSFRTAWSFIAPIVERIEEAVGFVTNSWIGRKLGLSGGPGAPGAQGAAGAPGAPGAGGPRLSRLAPGPYQRGGPAAGVARVHGRVETLVTFRNAPPGMRTSSNAHGITAPPAVNVGYAAPAFGF